MDAHAFACDRSVDTMPSLEKGRSLGSKRPDLGESPIALHHYDRTFVLDTLSGGGLLVEGFRRAVLDFLVGQGAISEVLRVKLLGWRHSGFSVHNKVQVAQNDAAGRTKLAGYVLRAPTALEKMRYDTVTGTVIYRSKM